MTTPIPRNLAFEDALTESLALKILKTIPTGYATRTIYNRGGYGYLKRTINGFNNAAKGTPFLVGTDLDRYECPPALINDWLTNPKHHNLLLRVAVREAEAWVLADRDSFANFLGIRAVTLPDDVEALPNPKATLIKLARRTRRKQLRDDICPPLNSTSRVGAATLQLQLGTKHLVKVGGAGLLCLVETLLLFGQSELWDHDTSQGAAACRREHKTRLQKHQIGGGRDAREAPHPDCPNRASYCLGAPLRVCKSRRLPSA